jgi:hypothetical protein
VELMLAIHSGDRWTARRRQTKDKATGFIGHDAGQGGGQLFRALKLFTFCKLKASDDCDLLYLLALSGACVHEEEEPTEPTSSFLGKV